MNIKEKAKELCTCPHKCKDTTDCVVEDDALLLINQDKSNNFDVKSNNLTFTLTNEEKVSVKVKQIEEMAEIIEEKNCIGVLCSECEFFNNSRCSKLYIAKALYNAGYRKQSEGKWIENRKVCSQPLCSVCGAIGNKGSYCSHCGTKMKGGEE